MINLSLVNLFQDTWWRRCFFTLLLLGLLIMLWHLKAMLVTLFVTFITCSTLLPLVETLERKGLPAWLAATLPFLLLILLVFLLILPVGFLAVQQLQALLTGLPLYFQQAQNELTHLWGQVTALHQKLGRQFPFLLQTVIGFPPDRLWQQTGGFAANLVNGFTDMTLAASRVVADSLTVSLLSLIILSDRRRVVHYLLSFIGPGDHPRYRALIHQLGRGVGGYVNSQLLLMLTGAILMTLGLAWVHFPYSLLFGILGGLAFAIPIFGPTLVMLPALLVAWLTSGLQVVEVVTVFAVVQLLQNHVIGPILMSRVLGLHPLAIILAIMAGGVLGGLTGILLAIPVAICINSLLQVYRQWIREQGVVAE